MSAVDSFALGGNLSLKSPWYIIQAVIFCLLLLMHWMACALCLALASAGSSIAARIAIMAITTNNSMRVKARAERADAGFVCIAFRIGFVSIIAPGCGKIQ